MQSSAQMPGIRRLGALAVADLQDSVTDWPVANEGLTVDHLPIKPLKGIATIFAVEGTAQLSYEKVSGRLHEDYMHQLDFELAGLTRLQAAELNKYVNTGVLLFAQLQTGELLVLGTKLAPMVVTTKGTTGKKAGDKRGYTITAQATQCPAPPIYLEGTVPWLSLANKNLAFSSAFSRAFK